MGTVGRLSHHVLVSRRRGTRRRSVLKRHHGHWAVSSFGHQREDHRAPASADTAAALAATLSGATHSDPAAAAARPPSVLDMPLATLSWGDPLRWLQRGWADFLRAPSIGLFYGACFVLMGWALLAVFEFAPQYTLALSAGFLLMGPFLCLGLYQVSRGLERGEPPNFWRSLTAWRISSAQLAIFAAILLVLEMLWGRAAMIVFAISFTGMPDFTGPLSSFLTEEYLTFFVTYTLVGGIFAALIYAISVISMPMILDRGVDAISAGLASMRLVSTQTGVMLLWAALISGLIVLALLPGFLGLLVVGPVLGHASWHAYRAVMPADGKDAEASATRPI